MNRFEQLIEYVINDEEQKARELFHDIVVEKSRQIYEDLMAEEAKEEELDEAAEELDEAAEEELDEAAEEEVEEGAMGGDAADDLIDEVEMEEESDINMEAQDDDMEDVEVDAEMDTESSDEPATKDDIMNLEDKLDELMAEFEQLMGGDDMSNGDDMAADEGGDAIEMDDTDEMMPMAEAVSLKAAPKPTTSEEGSVNKKSTVAANSGAKGMEGSPVKTDSTDEKGRKAPDAKDIITDFQNKAGAEMKAQKAAPKPVTSQASGVNTRTPFPKG